STPCCHSTLCCHSIFVVIPFLLSFPKGICVSQVPHPCAASRTWTEIDNRFRIVILSAAKNPRILLAAARNPAERPSMRSLMHMDGNRPTPPASFPSCTIHPGAPLKAASSSPPAPCTSPAPTHRSRASPPPPPAARAPPPSDLSMSAPHPTHTYPSNHKPG